MNGPKEFLASVFLPLSLLAFVWAAAALPVQSQNLRAATASSYIERGNEWFAKGEYGRALADYDLAIATDANQVNAYYNRALTRCQLGKFDEALADFDRAVKLDPRRAKTYNNRGVARAKQGDLDGAISDQTRALQLNPDFAEAISDRGVTRQLKGDLDGALADYNQAIKLNPRFAAVWFNRGTYWKAKGDLERAEADFTQAIENGLKPHLADAYAQRGCMRLLQGRAAEAQQDFDRCLALDKRLRQSLERLIAETKQQMATKR
jgi:Tfp pilus assembly protein PilF